MKQLAIVCILLVTPIFVGCDQSGDSIPLSPTNTLSSSNDFRVERFIVTAKYADVLFDENTYLIYDKSSGDALIIDPGTRSRSMEQYIGSRNLHVKAILNTHGHADHVGANGFYRNKYSCDIYANSREVNYYKQSSPLNLPTIYFTSEPTLSFGTIDIQMIYIPGHTEGGTCFYVTEYLLSGDALFKGSVGRTWPTSEMTAEELTDLLVENIKENILILPESTRVYPGHMDITTIRYEKGTNPYLR